MSLPKTTLLPTSLLAIFFTLCLGSVARAETLDARAHIEKATELISAGQPSLARTYLGPALIAPQLHSSERSKAYYLRGYSYQIQGLKVSALRDFHRALEFNPKNTMAQVNLGAIYYYGEGADPNYDLAFQLFTSAAEKEHPAALFHLGLANLYGKGVPKHVVSGRKWLEQAADLDYAPAMEHLAHSYRVDQSESPNAQLAKQWYEAAIAAGSDNAQVALAYMHAKGEFGEEDPTTAVSLLSAAANEGSVTARVALSQYYLTGDGVAGGKKDPAKALELLNLASAEGSAQADFRIGFLHQTGQGTKRDLAKAREYFNKAATAGLPLAQQHLAMLLVQSDTPADHVEGAQWLQRAARTNEPRALNDAAWVLATSKHSAVRNGESALQYAQKAVEGESDEQSDGEDLASYLDTLAAAYAELGRFDEAIATQTQAVALAAQKAEGSQATEAANGAQEVLKELNRHLDTYKNRQPWRE